ncbi:Galactose oxidase [Fulvia fulva]|uniref:Galactose oxidase n=1 Tax=Passalora fulva TaxID=5499 RepID=A0A9Q8UUW7_PASFU|nr:Galactose oxidase [Fulvia fulva]KAK4612213.1 Galactose oxidase [Fulvia fulva]KAK4613209.1 Galactose oxidase [Fulvia fulva]UJO23333.1 Galactose oxidase [Fulvia fulva]WPV21057.1 Galactose oxidase [Fulvia fulva]WPV35861.1 Galactose oxidase [Fulvia fulva]
MFDLSIGLLLAAASTTFAQNIGTWTSPIRFPIVPVAAAPLPGSNGQLLVWSGFNPADFESGKGRTQTAIYNPATGAVSRRTVTNTRHDMSVIAFPSTFNGNLMVT